MAQVNVTITVDNYEKELTANGIQNALKHSKLFGEDVEVTEIGVENESDAPEGTQVSSTSSTPNEGANQ